MKDLQSELMARMAESVPFPEMLRQVKRAIKEYEEDPNKQSEGFVVFVMQVTLMSHIIKRSGTTADDMLKDLEKHEKAMNLFKENNN